MKKKLAILSILAVCSTVLFAGCKKTEEIVTIQNGDTVTISYDSYLLDGEIIEENSIQTITIGENESFPIFDKELIGLKSGDTKEFKTSDPKEGYGIYYDGDIKVQKDMSPAIFNIIGLEPKVGEPINLGSLNGIILEVTPAGVTVDFNDRQTRENTEFHVTVLDIERTKE